MLQHLHIKNFALIAELEMDLASGFIVFSGETGAGKTIILNALNLVLGERASSELLRPGAEKLEVAAVFIGNGGQEIILKREVSSAGKSLARINGDIVTLQQLKNLGDQLVDLHGQHEHQSLLQTEKHLDFIDDFAGVKADRLAVADLFAELTARKNELTGFEERKKELEGKLDYLKFQLQEIRALNLKAGEDQELEREKAVLSNAGQLHQLAQGSQTALDEADALLRTVQLAEIADIDKDMQSEEQAFKEVLFTIEELKRSLGRYDAKIEFDPNRLEEIEERMAAISSLKRKHGEEIGGILAKQEQLSSEIEAVELGEDTLQDLRNSVKEKEAEYLKSAKKLSSARKAAAKKFEQEIVADLQLLAMNKTALQVYFAEGAPSVTGIDQVEFLISPNPGQPLLPLVKIASGGEISRIMLALKTILRKAEQAGTMIFDEIDNGIGGKTAIAVGEKLKGLAGVRQVICITHLPQIASKADQHFLVEKNVKAGHTEVLVNEVREKARQHEIARMLSGTVTETTLKHAAELLEVVSSH
ncbi:MAG: DNA repair protein RecN [Candidatus Margulisiibacteriota bacterium]|jgi:DNA repair protein RecN (Recombination protein N)